MPLFTSFIMYKMYKKESKTTRVRVLPQGGAREGGDPSWRIQEDYIRCTFAFLIINNDFHNPNAV